MKTLQTYDTNQPTGSLMTQMGQWHKQPSSITSHSTIVHWILTHCSRVFCRILCTSSCRASCRTPSTWSSPCAMSETTQREALSINIYYSNQKLRFCTITILGRGQPGLMRWILVWIMPHDMEHIELWNGNEMKWMKAIIRRDSAVRLAGPNGHFITPHIR